MSGKVESDTRDSGGRTRYGIAERFHPELTPTGFFDDLPNDEALPIAETIYRESYATKLQIVGIADQQIANAILSFGVNEGVGAATKVLQQALSTIRPLATDGVFGPGTLAAVNACGPSTLLALLRVFQRKHYEQIVASNPSDRAFLDGWLNRVDQNCKVSA